MKILFNCLTMEKGGAERVIALLANDFSKNNDVCIVTLKKSKDAYKLNSNIRRLCVDNTNYKLDGRIKRITRKVSLYRLNRLKKMILLEKPDIIISFLPEPSLELMLLSKISSRIRDIPKIISIRNDPEKEFSNSIIRKIMRRLYKDADGMVYQTEDAKKYFKSIIKTKHQTIIPNPIDPVMLSEPKSDARRKNIIISVGRLEAQKNHEMLIRAFGDSLRELKHDYLLKIYGEGSRHELLQDLIDELKLNNRVHLAGQIDNVSQALNSSKIFVLSSHYEGMPNALIEAMAMGLPCISTDCPCGGPRSLIRNGKSGILVKNDDERELCEAICELIKNNRKRVLLSKNALMIRESNGLKKTKEKWLSFIERILRSEG